MFRGNAVKDLVAFGDSLGIPVKYVCLLEYCNSRGAIDMGLMPDLGPGLKPVLLASEGRQSQVSTQVHSGPA